MEVSNQEQVDSVIDEELWKIREWGVKIFMVISDFTIEEEWL